MINEFEAIYITEVIKKLGWQFEYRDFGPNSQKEYNVFVGQFNYPKEFLEQVKIARIDQLFAEQTFFNIFIICYNIKNYLNQRYIINILEQYLEEKLNKINHNEPEKPYYPFIQLINLYILRYRCFYNEEIILKFNIKKVSDMIEEIATQPLQKYNYEQAL